MPNHAVLDLVALSVVSKSVHGSKNMVSTQNKLGHSTNSKKHILTIIMYLYIKFI